MEVTYEVNEGVALVGLRAPERKNALTVEMAEELRSVSARIRADPSVGAAVIFGHGGDFCAGAHRDLLTSLAQDPARDENYSAFETLYDSFHDIGRLPVPTMAATTGAVVGGGLNLMLCTDVRLVGSSTRVDASFLRIGIHPGGGFFTLARRTASDQTSAAMALFGQVLDAEDCVRHGLAWAMHDDAVVVQRACELAAHAARDPRLAREVVRTMRAERAVDMTREAALQLERAGQMWSLRRRAERTSSSGPPGV